MAFPTTGILDNFNRANTGPPPSANWSANSIAAAGDCSLSVVSNALVDVSGTFVGGYWSASTFGANSECYVTIATPQTDSTSLLMYVRLQSPGGGGVSGYYHRYLRDNSKPGGVSQIFRYDSSVATQLGASFNDTSGAMASGDKLGVDVVGSTITSYRFKFGGSWASLDSQSDATYGSAGNIGLRSSDGLSALVMDDFGGGTVSTPVDTGLAWIRA